MNKLILCFVIGMFLINTINAMEFDNVLNSKDISKDLSITIGEKELTNYVREYPQLEIKNAFGLGETLFKGAITKHTSSCGSNCESVLAIEHSGGVLIQNIGFIGTQPKEYKIQISTDIKDKIINDYEQQCTSKEITNENGTKQNELTCDQILTGNHLEEDITWKDYIIGTIVDRGNYRIKVSGSIPLFKKTDWQILVQGKWLNSWAVWDGTTIAYYKLDETAGTTAYSATGQYNGTLYGSVELNKAGKIGTAYNFSLNQSVNITNPLLKLDALHDGLTINTWIYSISPTTNDIVFGNPENASNGAFECAIVSNKLRCNFPTGSGTTSRIEGATSLNAEQWYMITVTQNSTGRRIYLNGTMEYENLTVVSWIGVPYNFTIGVPNQNNFNGKIDELGIWNRSLTSTEITSLYNNGNGLAYTSTGSATLQYNLTNYSINCENPTINYPTSSINPSLIGGVLQVNYSCSGTNYLENITLTNQRNFTLYNSTSTRVISWDYGIFNMRLNMKDSTGSLISQPKWTINGTTYTENPLTKNHTIFIGNLFNNTLNVTAEDLQGYSSTSTTLINFSITQEEYNITLSPENLTLNFYLENGTEYITKGYWIDSNGNNSYFEGNNLTIPLLNLPKGKVMVKFGYNLSSYSNYTQFYEFENDWETKLDENITIIQDSSIESYMKTTDKDTGDTINDVKVRIYQITPNSTTSKKFIGQQYTGGTGQFGSGVTFFFTATEKETWIEWDKTGYESDGTSADLTLEDYSSTNPYSIKLEKAITGVYRKIIATTCNWFNSETLSVPLTIYSPEGEAVFFKTSYSSTPRLIALNDKNRGFWNLTNGNEFINTEITNFSIYILDENYDTIITLIIPYWNVNENLFNEPEGLDSTTKARFLWIALILSVAILGLILKKADDGVGDGGNGKMFFFIGIFIISIISGGAFSWLLYVTGFYFLLMAINKLIKE